MTHLSLEIDKIKQKMFNMTDIAIESVVNSIKSLQVSDMDLAKKTIERDNDIDRLEMELDDDCIKVLATKQPAATDLRLVLSMLKISTDVERIGDLATNIAKETVRLNGKPTFKPLIDIPKMSELVVQMIKDSLTAIAKRDESLANQVIEDDKKVDDLNMTVNKELFKLMDENHSAMQESLGLMTVSKSLERIGDHATNIAEKAIYYIKGIDIRHS